MALRVVQWTTGNVGKESVKAIVANPGLELVGCYAWSPDKVGVDAGELVGIDPVGIAATNDVDALLALAPDCVVYNPMWPSVDELVRILEAGINVVATAAFITGANLGTERERLVAACEKGQTSLFGTGVSPGFAELAALTIAGMCNRIDKVTVAETADTTFYDSPDTERPAGFGMAIDSPDLPGSARKGTAVFGEAVAMVADGLGVELDEITCDEEYAQTTEDLVMASWTIPAGHVAGGRRQLAGQGRRPDARRAQRAVEEGRDPRPAVGDREGRLGDHRRGDAHRDGQPRLPPAAGLPGRDDRGLHGDRPHHHGPSRPQRHPLGRGRGPRDRDLCRPRPLDAARLGERTLTS